VSLRGVKVGNSIIDGEAESGSQRVAIEVKSGHDDVVRGMGQLMEALANGFNKAALVTSVRHARRIRPAVFNQMGLVLLGVNSKGIVRQIYPESSKSTTPPKAFSA
jgi:hypothetical protein